MCNFSDLIWIKSVTRNEGSEWAYTRQEIDENNELEIHWPEIHQPNANSPDHEDLILLYQSYHRTPHFTHVARFIDHQAAPAPENNPRYPWKRRVRIIKLGAIPKINLRNAPDLQGVSQGNACMISNMAHFNRDGNNLEEFRREVWDALTEL